MRRKAFINKDMFINEHIFIHSHLVNLTILFLNSMVDWLTAFYLCTLLSTTKMLINSGVILLHVVMGSDIDIHSIHVWVINKCQYFLCKTHVTQTYHVLSKLNITKAIKYITIKSLIS